MNAQNFETGFDEQEGVSYVDGNHECKQLPGHFKFIKQDDVTRLILIVSSMGERIVCTYEAMTQHLTRPL